MRESSGAEAAVLRAQLAQLTQRVADVARDLELAEANERSRGTSKPVTLIQFLIDRVAEDERLAQDAKPGPWRFVPESGGDGVFGPDSNVVEPGGMDGRYGATIDAPDGEHIVRWDPYRVLAECETKVRLIDDYLYLLGDEDADEEVAAVRSPSTPEEKTMERVLRILALPYALHPAYSAEWSPWTWDGSEK